MKTIVLLGVLAAAVEAMAVQGTIEGVNGDTKSGEIKWQPRAKAYLLTYKKGKTDVQAEFKLPEVAKLDINKPQGFDKAVDQVAKGQGAAAIPVLTKIVSDYRMLVWDKPAARYLAEAYVSTGKAQKAYEICQSVISDDRSAAYTGALAPAYWTALIKLGKREQLLGLLDKAASSGDRAASAAAFVARGDMIVSEGKDTPDTSKKALTDGYLRVVLMYTDPECALVRKEAMGKAAACLDKLGKASQAEQMRAQAKAL